MPDITENYPFAKNFQNNTIAKKWFHGGVGLGISTDYMSVRLQDNSTHHFDLNAYDFQKQVTEFFAKNKTHA